MKELYAICGYTDTFDKSSHLINNLNLLKSYNKETLLVNHFPVDPIVYKDFDFYTDIKCNFVAPTFNLYVWNFKR